MRKKTGTGNYIQPTEQSFEVYIHWEKVAEYPDYPEAHAELVKRCREFGRIYVIQE
jgi:hypothetical protein